MLALTALQAVQIQVCSVNMAVKMHKEELCSSVCMDLSCLLVLPLCRVQWKAMARQQQRIKQELQRTHTIFMPDIVQSMTPLQNCTAGRPVFAILSMNSLVFNREQW